MLPLLFNYCIGIGCYVVESGQTKLNECMYNHSHLGGSGGMPPQQNFENMVFKEGPVSRSGVQITTASFICTIIYLKYLKSCIKSTTET